MTFSDFATSITKLLMLILRALAILAFVVLGILLLYGFQRLFELEYAKLSSIAVNAWVSVMGYLLIIALVAAVLILAWRLLRLLIINWSLFGDTHVARIVGLGITCLVFPYLLGYLIGLPIVALSELVRDLPSALLRIQPLGEIDRTVNLDQAALRLANLLQLLGGQVARTVSDFFNRISLPDLAQALALWAIIGQLLSSARPRDDGQNGSGRLVLISYLENLSELQRKNLVLASLLLFGAYLSIAAIVAIPWLQDDKPHQALSAENLRKQLETVIPRDGSNRAALKPSSTDWDQRVTRRLEKLKDMEKEERFSTQLSDIALIVNTLDEADRARKKALDLQKTLEESISHSSTTLLSSAVNAFADEAIQPMNAQERAFLFREIREKSLSRVAELNDAGRNCAQAIRRGDDAVNNYFADSTSLMSLSSPSRASDTTARLFGLQIRSGNPYVDADRACSASVPVTLTYGKLEPGSGWGPFGAVAKWLLTTKSLALTLITGMLGFGLLGASVASFVRAQLPNPAQTPAKAEAWEVIIRGVSAALVIFLAVKGGLAIFGSSTQEPNPYMLFLTCLVGAVFSDDVWAWARQRLQDGLAGKQKQVDAAAGKQGNAPAPKKPVNTSNIPPKAE